MWVVDWYNSILDEFNSIGYQHYSTARNTFIALHHKEGIEDISIEWSDDV